jgi:hypothetical protein
VNNLIKKAMDAEGGAMLPPFRKKKDELDWKRPRAGPATAR